MNRDIVTRDTIIWGKYEKKKYMGGYRRFDDLPLDALKALIADKFIRLWEAQNDGSTVGEILQFMEKYPEYKAIGYAISLEREDYRVTLEGVYKDTEAASEDEMNDFMELFGAADELNTEGYMRAWFD